MRRDTEPDGLGSMQHRGVKIPEQEPSIFAHAAEAVVSIVASPGVECDAADPGVVAWASGHEPAFG